MNMPLDICLPDIYPCGCPDERHREYCLGLECADVSNEKFMQWLSKMDTPKMFSYNGKNYWVECHETLNNKQQKEFDEFIERLKTGKLTDLRCGKL